MDVLLTEQIDLEQVGGATLSAIYNIGSLVADAKEWFPSIPWQYHAIIGFVLFAVFMLWIVIDRQVQVNTVKGNVRLVPIPRGVELKRNTLTGETYTEIVIDLEIWADRDIHTDSLVLNIVGTRIALLAIPWWKIWEQFYRILLDYPLFKHIVGLRTEGGLYRKHIKADEQLFKDTVTFELRGKEMEQVLRWSNVFMMELVLLAGIPNTTYRQYLRRHYTSQAVCSCDY